MFQERFSFLDLRRGVFGIQSETPLFALLREGIRNDRINKVVARLDVILDLVPPKLGKTPRRPIVHPRGRSSLRRPERADKLISWMIQNCGILTEWGRRWIGEASRERADVFAKQKLGRRIEGETLDQVLHVDGVPRARADLELVDGILRVFLKDVKVADAIADKERAGHGTMEPVQNLC